MEKVKCPCCGKQTLDEAGVWDICEHCGWEDDPLQSKEPDLAGGANKPSLNEARKLHQAGKSIK